MLKMKLQNKPNKGIIEIEKGGEKTAKNRIVN
jgi:hypothetical protein